MLHVFKYFLLIPVTAQNLFCSDCFSSLTAKFLINSLLRFLISVVGPFKLSFTFFTTSMNCSRFFLALGDAIPCALRAAFLFGVTHVARPFTTAAYLLGDLGNRFFARYTIFLQAAEDSSTGELAEPLHTSAEALLTSAEQLLISFFSFVSSLFPFFAAASFSRIRLFFFR